MKIHHSAFCVGLAAFMIFTTGEPAQAKKGSLLNPETILTLAKGLEFSGRHLASGPVVPEYAPNFHIDINFQTEMLEIPAGAGTIAGKVEIKGVPAHYRIPDGSYYLWMGVVDGSLRAAFATMDGTLQTELCAQDLPENTNLSTDRLGSSIGPTPCEYEKLAQVRPFPSPRPVPLPRPPPTQKRVVRRICYTENGDKPTTKYRKGVVYVPDS